MQSEYPARESRGVVVHHLGFWSRGPWFKSGRDYLRTCTYFKRKAMSSINQNRCADST